MVLLGRAYTLLLYVVLVKCLLNNLFGDSGEPLSDPLGVWGEGGSLLRVEPLETGFPLPVASGESFSEESGAFVDDVDDVRSGHFFPQIS